MRNRRRGKPRVGQPNGSEVPRQDYRGNGFGQHARDQKLNWRNRNDITLYYFMRFPDDVSEKDLWTHFRRWGEVREVFIPKQRNRRGRRYGFVRFKGVFDKNRLEKQLNRIILGGLKMYVNLPRYGRANEKHNKLTADIGSQGQSHKEKGGTVAVRRSTLPNNASMRTYAEALATNTHKTGQMRHLNTKLEGHGGSHSSAILDIPEGEKRWYTDAWVGRLKKLNSLERLEDEITWMLGSDVTPKYLGDDMFILLGLSDSKAEEIIKEETDKGVSLFYSLQKWKPDMKPEARLVWI